MAARSERKFRIELLQEQHSSGKMDKSGPVPTDPNMAAHYKTLLAVEELREELREGGGSLAPLAPDTERIIQEKVAVESELKLLAEALETTKKEIAGLRYSASQGDRIVTMNHQLDAITSATEDATNRILSAAEIIDGDIQKLQANASSEEEITAFEVVSDEVIKIYEACNFQDLTGQRITKVIETLKHVEERVDVMIKGLGGDDEAFASYIPEEEETEDVALEGPQSEGDGISQSDIDSLFD